jgi:hypothetical protein
MFDSTATRAGLRLVVDCPPLPEPIYVDRELWEKIVLNLLSNALKFTVEGESFRSMGQMAYARTNASRDAHAPMEPRARGEAAIKPPIRVLPRAGAAGVPRRVSRPLPSTRQTRYRRARARSGELCRAPGPDP